MSTASIPVRPKRRRGLRPGTVLFGLLGIVTVAALGDGLYEVVLAKIAAQDADADQLTADQRLKSTLRWLNGAVSRMGDVGGNSANRAAAETAPRPDTETEQLKARVAELRRQVAATSFKASPSTWVASRAKLGGLLAELGERTNNADPIREAVQSLRAALHVESGDSAVKARTAANLGNALVALASREPGTSNLEEALLTYRDALQMWTREDNPNEWAEAESGLGKALRLLGQREHLVDRLEQAATAFRSALEVWTQNDQPLKWAAVQVNLAGTYLDLGRMGGAKGRYTSGLEAVDAAAIVYKELDAGDQLKAAEQLRNEIVTAMAG